MHKESLMPADIAKQTSPSRSLIVSLSQQMRQVLPFSEMDAVHVDFFVEHAQEEYFSPGEVFLSPESPPVNKLYFLRKGGVISRRGLANNAGEVHEIDAGELFPVSAAVAGRSVTASYAAIGDCFCLSISTDEMKRLAEMSLPFSDFLSQSILKFLERSWQVLQSTYTSQIFSEQSLETPLGELPRKKPLCVTPETSIKDALTLMHDLRVGSILVSSPKDGLVGILTRYDILGRVTIPQIDLNQPIAEVMTQGVKSLTVRDTAQDAALIFLQLGIRHIPVMDGDEIVNILSERDLFAMQRLSLKHISMGIRSAADLSSLVLCAKDIRRFAKNLIGQGVQAKQLTRLISDLNDLIGERLIELNAAKHHIDLRDFAWIALGSEGRSEQTIATDQDNALVFAGEASDAIRDKYLAFALDVNHDLDACGYPLCKGNVMASNPQICLSEAEWIEQFTHWIEQGSGENLLKASIYFDFRCIAGNPELLVKMKEIILTHAPKNQRFMKQLADNSLRMKAPINWHGGMDTIKLDGKQCIDLKKHGTAILVDTSRVFALAHAIPETNTRERLIAIGKALKFPESEYMSWVTAFEYLQMLRLSIQIDEADIAGNPNAIELSSLNHIDRRILKESLSVTRNFQQRLERAFDH
jgi:CBS domain-containing protein